MEMCTCRHTPRWHGLLGCAWCDCRSRTGPHQHRHTWIVDVFDGPDRELCTVCRERRDVTA